MVLDVATKSAYRMADFLAGGKLDAILRDAKANGESLRSLAARLRDDYAIPVTIQTLANWLKEIEL